MSGHWKIEKSKSNPLVYLFLIYLSIHPSIQFQSWGLFNYILRKELNWDWNKGKCDFQVRVVEINGETSMKKRKNLDRLR
jgi:hypothetical protein